MNTYLVQWRVAYDEDVLDILELEPENWLEEITQYIEEMVDDFDRERHETVEPMYYINNVYRLPQPIAPDEIEVLLTQY